MPTVFRLAKRRYPVYDGSGAALEGARWNSPGRVLIYASEHYATALLEKLVHAGRTQLPGAHHAAAIEIPDDYLAGLRRCADTEPASTLSASWATLIWRPGPS